MACIIALTGVAALCGSGQETASADANLLKSWKMCIDGAKDTVNLIDIKEDGIIYCDNKELKAQNGVWQTVYLNQAEAAPILFSAENKGQDVSGEPDSVNYSIYLDITYADESHTYGVAASFKTGTHDWEKVSSSYSPEKPIKSISCNLLFRNKTGKAWFRNAILTQEKK